VRLSVCLNLECRARRHDAYQADLLAFFTAVGYMNWDQPRPHMTPLEFRTIKQEFEMCVLVTIGGGGGGGVVPWSGKTIFPLC
jgi:hypothetical protein